MCGPGTEHRYIEAKPNYEISRSRRALSALPTEEMRKPFYKGLLTFDKMTGSLKYESENGNFSRSVYYGSVFKKTLQYTPKAKDCIITNDSLVIVRVEPEMCIICQIC